MIDKLAMAHDWAMKVIDVGYVCETDTLALEAWKYVDAMQAEADKRKKEKLDEVRQGLKDGWFTEKEGQHFDDVAALCKTDISSGEWQPDWSQAPDDRIDHWSKESDGTATWWIGEPTRNVKEGTHHDNDNCTCVEDAPSFGYQGDWKNSLRKRPEIKAGKRLEVG